MMDISKLQITPPLTGVKQPGKIVSDSKVDGGNNVFKDALESLSRKEAASDQLVQQLAAGEDVDVHQVMIALEETDLSFRIVLAIRDRLVEAYKEVMRMSV